MSAETFTAVDAAVVWGKGEPFAIERIEVRDPGPRDVLVAVRAVGVCHTDLLARDGEYPSPLPLVCGHEGAGVVEAVGPEVTKVSPGDEVVLSYVSCGHCENCRTAHEPYCDDMFALNFGGRDMQGRIPFRSGETDVYGGFVGQSSFATRTVVHERAVVRIPSGLDPEIVAPLGCGVQTGAGAVANTLAPTAGTSIAVFGVGSVGLSSVMMAAVCGCHPIIAIDTVPSRLRLAAECGATHTIDASAAGPLARIAEITGGGAQHSVEASGTLPGFRQAVDCLRETGVCALVGATAYGTEGTIDMTTVLRGRTIRGVICGDATSDVFIPRLIELWQAGHFPLERMITTFPFAQINEAIAACEEGTAIKAVLDVEGYGAQVG